MNKLLLVFKFLCILHRFKFTVEKGVTARDSVTKNYVKNQYKLSILYLNEFQESHYHSIFINPCLPFKESYKKITGFIKLSRKYKNYVKSLQPVGKLNFFLEEEYLINTREGMEKIKTNSTYWKYGS